MTGMPAYMLRIAFWVTVALGALALALTASGLFSVLSFLVEQRAKEIGVRMALGATTSDIARLVLLQSFGPVGVGLLAGGGLAAGLAAILTATPAASAIGGIVHVFDPVAYGSSVLVIILASILAALVPAVRAARPHPVATLRND
ncbi:MAG TPA: FtsX-like permease family protein [Vicinamibacterales bacterium]|nr:FtsX-like permease family protein [Vicinamibacterales bacterium]